MTEVASAPRPARRRRRRAAHLPLDRRPPRRAPRGARGPVYNPATGEQTGRGRPGLARRGHAAVAAAEAAFPAWRAASLSRRAAVLFRSASCWTAHRDELAALVTAEHGKVPSDALGEVARGLENVEFATGIPHCSRAASREQARRAWTSTRSASRWAWSPASRRSTSRPWCRCGCSPTRIACGNAFVLKPSEKDPSASLLLAELLAGGRVPGRRVHRRAGRQGGGGRAARAPRRRGGELRRLHADRALHLRDRHRARQARAGARRGEEPHGRAARRRRRHGRRRRGVGRLRLGRGAVHGASRSWSPSATWRDPLVDAIASGCRKVEGRQRSRPGQRDGPADQRASTATGWPATSTRCASRAPSVVVDGRQGDLAGRRLLPRRPRCWTGSRRRWTSTPTRSSARCSRWCGSDLRRGGLAGQREPVRQRHRHLHPRRRRGPPVPVRGRGGHGRHQRADPGAGGVLLASAAGRRRCSATRHMYGPEGVNFYTRGKVVTSRWPDPATSSVNLGFPRTR